MDFNLLRSLPNPRAWVARLISIIVFGLLCALAGAATTALHLRGDIATTRERARACLAANDKALAALQRAKDGLAKAVRQAEQRKATADAAVAKARADASPLRQRASRIATAEPPPGVSLCDAARQAFDAELASERRP